MRFSRWTYGVLFVASTACGGSSSSSPTAPTPAPQAAPTVTSLTINGPDAILTSTSADYTATANLSNQTTQTVTATWTTGGATASVSSIGRVTGQAHGSLMLAASYQGLSASKTVNVVSNYDGRWTGVVVRLTCQLNGALGRRITQRLCPAGPNERMPMSFDIFQPAPSFTEVTAVLNLANIILNVSGTVANDGRLVLGGETEYQWPDPVSQKPQTVRFSVLKWDTRLAGFTLSLMAGRFDRNRTESLWQGNVYEEYEIEQMRRAPGLTGIIDPSE
jgi:hypothetical protein